MKNVKISHRVFNGSGPLSLVWIDAPKGDAVESLSGSGVAFFAHNNDLLAVEFDDVSVLSDQQELVFANGAKVSIEMKNAKLVKLKAKKAKKAA